MSDSFTQSVDTLVAGLKKEIERCSLEDPLSAMLCWHFLGERASQLGLTPPTSVDLKEWMNRNNSPLHEAPSVSVLGSLAYEETRKGNSLSTQAKATFRDGLTGLSARQRVFSSPNSWMHHSANVLGVGLGISVIDEIPAEQSLWWQETLQEGLQRRELPLFLRLAYAYGLYMLTPSLVSQLSPSLIPGSLEHCSLAELALSVWMVKRGILPHPTPLDKTDWLERIQPHWFSNCLLEGIETLSSFKAAVALEVLSEYIFSRAQYPRLELVIGLLSNFSAAMERWSNRWPIEDEYDVQSLLWLILRSAFNDARYEENLPKFGRSGHRYDIGLPQLGLLVEAKYIRDPEKDFQKIVDEIGKDSAQVTTQATFKEILVFIYDASRAAEHHDWTKRTVEQIARVKGCIIHSAPSSLESHKSTQKKLIKRSGKTLGKS